MKENVIRSYLEGNGEVLKVVFLNGYAHGVSPYGQAWEIKESVKGRSWGKCFSVYVNEKCVCSVCCLDKALKIVRLLYA